VTQHTVELPYIKHGLEQGGLFAAAIPRMQGTSMSLFAPLSFRGWTVQERALSRRALYFARDGIWWNCRHFGCNCFRHDGKIFCDHQIQFRDYGWAFLLKEFLSCKLTVPTDNLAAVEGMARRVGAQRKDEYYFGCWMGELPQQILWYGEAKRLPELADRPTWSWASTAQAHQVFWDTIGKREETLICQSFEKGGAGRLRVSQCPTLSTLRMGEPASNASALSAAIGKSYMSSFEYSCTSYLQNVFPIRHNGKVVGIGIIDDLRWFRDNTRSGHDLAGCFFARDRAIRSRDEDEAESHDGEFAHYGLVLIPIEGEPDSYLRAGLLVVYSLACFDEAVLKDITLL
jgi:hypothetical protein